MTHFDDPQLTRDDSRSQPVKRKRAVRRTLPGHRSARCDQLTVVNPMSEHATPTQLRRVYAGSELGASYTAQMPILSLKGNSLRKYKWWGRRSRVVINKLIGSEYANGRRGAIIKQLENNRPGGKIDMKGRVGSSEGLEPKMEVISSKPAA